MSCSRISGVFCEEDINDMQVAPSGKILALGTDSAEVIIIELGSF